jgi:hypothetical protein
MAGYLIQTDGRSLADVQRQLRKYLPGLDVRLFPVGPDRALLRGHLLEALQREYQSPPEVWLKVLGIQSPRLLRDDEIPALLHTRDAQALPSLQPPAPAPVDALDWHLAMVRAPAAWARLGGPDQIAWGPTLVAQLDTGYTQHPALGFVAGETSWVDVARAITDVPGAPNGGDHFQPAEPGGGLDPMALAPPSAGMTRRPAAVPTTASRRACRTCPSASPTRSGSTMRSASSRAGWTTPSAMARASST